MYDAFFFMPLLISNQCNQIDGRANKTNSLDHHFRPGIYETTWCTIPMFDPLLCTHYESRSRVEISSGIASHFTWEATKTKESDVIEKDRRRGRPVVFLQ